MNIKAVFKGYKRMNGITCTIKLNYNNYRYYKKSKKRQWSKNGITLTTITIPEFRVVTTYHGTLEVYSCSDEGL